MSDDDQTLIPRSFIELYIAPGKIKPSEPRGVIATRHDLCEDMAQMLTEHARTRLFELGITEHDVLERIHRGLLAPASMLSESEAGWVVRRLAELLDWPALQAPLP